MFFERPERLAAHVVINVHVPVSTVLDLSREPGTPDGYGAISAEHVRPLRPHSWRRVMVGASSGRPIAIDDRATQVADGVGVARAQVVGMLQPATVVDADEPQHDPSARLARLVDVRDMRCCGPGCSATRTHRDHLVPHPVGPTSAGNLGRLSPRCHRAKHGGWHLVRHPDGSVTWTSPLGRVYVRPSPHEPPPRVDLWQDLPPLRPAPVAAALPGDSDPGLAARATGHETEPGTGLGEHPTGAHRGNDHTGGDSNALPPDPTADVAPPF